jgi:hypothetical protein
LVEVGWRVEGVLRRRAVERKTEAWQSAGGDGRKVVDAGCDRPRAAINKDDKSQKGQVCQVDVAASSHSRHRNTRLLLCRQSPDRQSFLLWRSHNYSRQSVAFCESGSCTCPDIHASLPTWRRVGVVATSTRSRVSRKGHANNIVSGTYMYIPLRFLAQH